jgi:hypothetical protein
MINRHLTLLTLFFFLFFSMEENFAQSAKAPKQSQKKSKSGTVSLFNGKNLEGWYTYLINNGRDNDPDKVFKVEKGLIKISGKEYGCITTNEEYENYKLVVEFKWGTETHEPRLNKARDNGVLIHSQGKDGAFSKSWMYSIECQIIEGGTGDFLVVGDGSDRFSITSPVVSDKKGGPYVFQPGGKPLTINMGRIDWFGRDPAWKDVVDFRGSRDVEKPVGEWNKMEVIAKGDNIDLYLNGVLVNSATKVKPSKGRIQIQSEGAEMYVRKVDLTPIN